MKHPTGNVKPRRLAAPKPRKKVRLDLKRRPEAEPEYQFPTEKKNNFWKWVGLVALLHLLVIGIACLFYEFTPKPPPPEPFISLLPEGDVVKGTPGAQEAHKVGPTSSAPTVHHHKSTPPAAKAPTTPSIKPPAKPKPLAAVTPIKPLLPPPTLTPPPEPSPSALDKPVVKPPPPKPAPEKPKVKVDLTLAEAPTTAFDKPKHHPKKPAVKPTEDNDDQEAADNPDSTGLSKEQIAAKLGEKLDEAGVKDATHTGASGSSNTRQNQFSEFYQMITQQIDEQWQIPNVAANAIDNPLVHIYVEKDGRVSPESVYLVKSSGNSTYDDSAVAAAKNLGYLHEPLPEGCPPDIFHQL